MASVEELLNKLADERASYPDFVAAVDADLKVERLRRLAVRQGTIMNLVAEAFAQGASKRAIMRAYGTKDFNTIQKILDSMAEQIALTKQQATEVEQTHADWFEVKSPWQVFIGEADFHVIDFENGEFMLDQSDGPASPEWDGRLLGPEDEGDSRILFEAIREAQ